MITDKPLVASKACNLHGYAPDEKMDTRGTDNGIENEILAFITKRTNVEKFYLTEPRLLQLIESCKTEIKAIQVWLFGSRVRGDHH